MLRNVWSSPWPNPLSVIWRTSYTMPLRCAIIHNTSTVGNDCVYDAVVVHGGRLVDGWQHDARDIFRQLQTSRCLGAERTVYRACSVCVFEIDFRSNNVCRLHYAFFRPCA